MPLAPITMFRPVLRAALRPSASFASSDIRVARRSRFISTTSPKPKSRTWTSRLVRLGLAGGAVYYYNTSSLFAEQSHFSFLSQTGEGDASYSTSQRIPQNTLEKQSTLEVSSQTIDINAAAPSDSALAGSLEEQVDQEGAFNPETGEINWDCPCLGGMAHGPCGEEFKAAFSCFVFSKEEPKGMDCIDKFKGMQDCFRQHPNIYGSELDEDEVDAQLGDTVASTSHNNTEFNTASPSKTVSTTAASEAFEKKVSEIEVNANASQS